jgi:hypothetical protein
MGWAGRWGLVASDEGGEFSLLARRPGKLVPSSLFANKERVRSSLLRSPAGAYRRSQRIWRVARQSAIDKQCDIAAVGVSLLDYARMHVRL